MNAIPTDAEHTARTKAMMLDLTADEIIACIEHLAATRPNGSMFLVRNYLEEIMGAYICQLADATNMMEVFNEVLAEEARELTYDEAKMICRDLACSDWNNWGNALTDAFYERAREYLSDLAEERANLRSASRSSSSCPYCGRRASSPPNGYYPTSPHHNARQ